MTRVLTIGVLFALALGGCKTRQFDTNAVSNTKDDPLIKRPLDNDDVFKIVQCKTHLNENNIEFKQGSLEVVFSKKRSDFFSERVSRRLNKQVKLGYLTFEGVLGFDGTVSHFTKKQFFNLFDMGWSMGSPPLVSHVEKTEQGSTFHFFREGCTQECGNTITIRADDDIDSVRFESAVKLVLNDKSVVLETVDFSQRKEQFRFKDCKINNDNVKLLQDSLK